ncbi:hypothetical protein GGG16DRAFT_86815, partial [Schizophyllum commune]
MRQSYALTIYPLAALWLSRFLVSLASSLPIIASLLVRRAIYRASSNTHHLLAVVVRHRRGMDTTALNPPRSVALPGSPLMLAPQGASVPSTYKCNDPDECITPLYHHHLRRPIPSAPALLPPPATRAAAPRYEPRRLPFLIRTPSPRIRTTHVPIHLPPANTVPPPPHSFIRPIYRSLCSYLVLYSRTLVVGVGMRTRLCRVVV